MTDFGMSTFTNQMNQASNMYNDGVLAHNKDLDDHLNTALATLKNSKEGKIADVLVHTGDVGKEAFLSTEVSEAVKNYKKYKTAYKVDDVGHAVANKNYLSDKANNFLDKFKTGEKNEDDVAEDKKGTQVERDTKPSTEVPTDDDPVSLRTSGKITTGKPQSLFRSSEGTDALEEAGRNNPIPVRQDPRFRLSMSDDAIDTAGENVPVGKGFKNVSLNRQVEVARPRSPVQEPEPQPEQTIEERNADTGTENSGDTGASNETEPPTKTTDTSSAPTTNEEITPSDDTPAKSFGGKLKTALSEKTGITEEGLDTGLYGAKKLIGGTMGVVSTIEDISQGKLAGDNKLEKAGDVVGQIGAYTDLIGTAIPILEPVGAVTSLVGGLLTGIGHIEDDIEEKSKNKKAQQDLTDKEQGLKDKQSSIVNYSSLGLVSSMSRNPRLQIAGTGAF